MKFLQRARKKAERQYFSPYIMINIYVQTNVMYVQLALQELASSWSFIYNYLYRSSSTNFIPLAAGILPDQWRIRGIHAQRRPQRHQKTSVRIFLKYIADKKYSIQHTTYIIAYYHITVNCSRSRRVQLPILNLHKVYKWSSCCPSFVVSQSI